MKRVNNDFMEERQCCIALFYDVTGLGALSQHQGQSRPCLQGQVPFPPTPPIPQPPSLKRSIHLQALVFHACKWVLCISNRCQSLWSAPILLLFWNRTFLSGHRSTSVEFQDSEVWTSAKVRHCSFRNVWGTWRTCLQIGIGALLRSPAPNSLCSPATRVTLHWNVSGHFWWDIMPCLNTHFLSYVKFFWSTYKGLLKSVYNQSWRVIQVQTGPHACLAHPLRLLESQRVKLVLQGLSGKGQ